MGLFDMFKPKGDAREQFWSWFATEAPTLSFPPSRARIDAIGNRLHEVDRRLAYQIGRAGDGLVIEISADGNPELVPTVLELCAVAPPIPGWSVQAFRQASPGVRVRFGDLDVSADTMSFVFEVVHGKAHLEVFVDALDSGGPELGHAAFMLLEATVGELAMLTSVGEIDLFDGSEAPQNARSVSALPEVLAALAKH